jgi:hypothetical protein
LTFGEAVEYISVGDSRRSQVARINLEMVPAERPHPKALHSHCAPEAIKAAGRCGAEELSLKSVNSAGGTPHVDAGTLHSTAASSPEATSSAAPCQLAARRVGSVRLGDDLQRTGYVGS